MVCESYQSEFALGRDLEGPRVALEFMRHMQRNGDHACGWWSQFKQHKRNEDGDRVNFEAMPLAEF